MGEQPGFEFAFVKWLFERQKIEHVRVFQGFACKVRLSGWKRRL